jgi:hypothetical protein
MTRKIDDVANMWNETKDPKYKKLWYDLVKEFSNGPNNIDRRTISPGTSDETNAGGPKDIFKR